MSHLFLPSLLPSFCVQTSNCKSSLRSLVGTLGRGLKPELGTFWEPEFVTCFLCVQQLSQKPLFVPGVWGPCLSAMVPELWLNEGGQSATGRLVRPPPG